MFGSVRPAYFPMAVDNNAPIHLDDDATLYSLHVSVVQR
jgi:hypothetical protein